MFESLSEKLQGAFRRFGSKGVITEKDLDEVMREVRMALLEADVNFKVVREFTARVRERAEGSEVLRSLTPAQQIIDIVNQELTAILGGEQAGLVTAPKPPTIIMLVGLQGSGKTTSAAKLALTLKKNGSKPLLVACDVYRPAAIEQLKVLGDSLAVDVYTDDPSVKPLKIARDALEHGKRIGATHVLVDTAGRLHVDEQMMGEVAELRRHLEPQEVLFVADAMAGQDAVTAADEFHKAVGTTGLILTKMDGDARGGAALSIRAVTGVPVKFIGVGEKTEALEAFHPDRLASRILGMGDMLTLIEKAKSEMGEDDADKLSEKMKKGSLNLEDFLDQMQKVRRMGPLSQLVGMLPGLNSIKMKLDVKEMDEDFFRKTEAIVRSMTPHERRHPETINGSRRRRIAQGSGTTPQDVNQLLNQFKEAKKIMKTLTSGRMPGGLPIPGGRR
jgi:signal recognition particle subunit SRP54